MKAMAKTYRRDPIDFFWMEDNTWQENIRQTLGVVNLPPQLVVVKAGKRPRVAVSSVESEKTLERFLDGILEGVVQFASLSAVPIYEEAKPKTPEDAGYDEHIEL